MNQVFDFNRLTLLVAKHWSENRKKYLLGSVAMAGLLFFWYGFLLTVNWGRSIDEDLQANTYFFGLAIAGLFFGSTTFTELASGPRAMNFLTFPASHLEKLLCSLLFSIVIFFVAYTAIFYLVDFTMVKITNSIAANDWEGTGPAPVAEVVNVFWKKNYGNPEPINLFLLILLIYITAQSAYILGSVYFTKYSFIKTTIALLALSFLLGLFVSKVLLPAMPKGGYFDGIASFQFYENGNYDNAKLVRLPQWVSDILGFLLRYALAPILWVVTYFRLKEKEV